MTKPETFPCHYCEGTGIRLGVWDREPCEECEGTGKKDYVSFDSAAEMLEWLGTDVED